MSNLLKDASILLTPTGYDNGSMNAIKPENGDGDFTFSRNSAATRVNAQGLVENVQILSSNLVSNGDFSQEGAEQVTNGSFSQEGAELVTNGNFATDADWLLENGAVINNGSVNLLGNNSKFRQTPLISGKSYKLVYEVISTDGGSFRFQDGVTAFIDVPQTIGIHTYYFKATGNRVQFQATSAIDARIDNVSVKEVGQDWTLGGSGSNAASIGSNSATITSVDGNSYIQQNSVLTSGKSYKISYEILSSSGSSVLKMISSLGLATVPTTVGTHTVYGTAVSTTFYIERVSNGMNATITNISVKEVGQDWTLGSGWSIGEDKAISDGSGFGALSSSYSNFNSKKLKVNFDILNYVSGEIRVPPSYRQDGLDIRYSANGSYELIYDSINSAFALNTVNFNGSVTNISVIEITDDTNLPRINYEGFSYQDSLGSELIVNGDFATDSAWNKGTGWSIANGTASHTGGASYLSQSVLQVDTQYKVNISVTSVSGGGFIQIYMGNSPASVFISTIGDYTYYFTSQSSVVLGFALRSSGDVSIDNVSVKEYLGQEVVPNSGCGSWLMENQATNLITQSEDFSNASWTKTGLTVNSNSAISPDGNLNASLITMSTGGYGSVYTTTTSISGTTYTSSVYGKKGNQNYLSLEYRVGAFPGNADAVFDLNTGVVTSGTGIIEDVGNGWYRCSVTKVSTSSSALLIIGRGISGSSNDTVYLYGAQLEQQSYATSLIPTQGASSTRLADIATNSGNASLINSEEGVLYAEIAALANDGFQKAISIYKDGSLDNIITIQYNSISNNIRYLYRQGVVSVSDLNFVVNDIKNNHKIAGTWKQNEFKLFIDGIKVGEQLFGSVAPLNTFVNLDFKRPDGHNFYGKNKALAVYKTALTDASLRSLTYPPAVATTFDLNFNTIADDFTFTRGSEATFVNAQGLIQSTNEIGSELVTNGDFSNGSANWIISGGNAQISNGKLNLTNAVIYGTSVNNSATVVSGKTYLVKYTISDYVGGSSQIRLGSQFGTSRNSNGTFSEYIVANDTAIRIYSSSSNTTLSIDNVSVKEYITATNTPRLDYSTGAEAFLLEPQSTNLITYSEDFSNASWSKYGTPTIDITSIISPDGTLNGTKVTRGSNATPLRRPNLTTLGTEYTFSLYAKKGSVDKIYLDIGDVADVEFTLTDEWQRFEITQTPTNFTHIDISFGTSVSGDHFFIYGAQLEQQSYPTSYIPTSGASATRNQELCNNATPVINSEEGTLYAEISALGNDVSRLISISDGSTSNQVSFEYSVITNLIRIRLISEGVEQSFYQSTSYDYLQYHKIAISYKLNNFKIYIDGTEVYTDTSSIMPIGLNELSFANGTNGSPFSGNTKDLKYYPKALADVQLEDLTTI